MTSMTDRDLRRTYFPNYFSIDNILACQTPVPCRTEIRLPKFGFLVPDCQSEDIPAGVNLELPLWAARVLCKPGRKYVSVNIPPGFKAAHREVTEGNPARVDLKKIHSQYFEAGHLCTSLFHNDAGELAEMLPEVLQQRILCIGESTIPYAKPAWARKVYSSEPIPQDRMDILELKIFQDADERSKCSLDWLDTIRNVPPSTAASSSSSSFHSAQQLAQKPMGVAQPMPQQPIAVVHPQQHQTVSNVPHVQNTPHQQQAIITSSHQNPYGSGGNPAFMPQYLPMNMSLNHGNVSAPPAHSLSNQPTSVNFQQSLPYQQQQQQHHHHHHSHHQHHHHNNNMM